MLLFYREGKTSTQAAGKKCAVYEEGTAAERIVLKCFARFKAGDFNLQDQERPDRPATIDEAMLFILYSFFKKVSL